MKLHINRSFIHRAVVEKMRSFLEVYPEFKGLFPLLPTEAKEWLDQFCETYTFGLLIEKFLDHQLQYNDLSNENISYFLGYATFYSGNIRLIHRLLQNSLNLFSHWLGYLLLATSSQDLPKISTLDSIIKETELLIILAWSEFRNGHYSRVLGLLSNLSIDIDNEDPLIGTLYTFLLMNSYIETRQTNYVLEWKDLSLEQLKQDKYSKNRILSGFLEIGLGIYFHNIGELTESKKWLELSWEKFKAFSNYYFLFRIGENLGLLAQKQKDYDRAFEIFKNLLTLRKEMKEEEVDPLQVYRVVTYLSDLSQDLGDLELAVSYAEEAVELFTQFKLPDLDAIFQLSRLYAMNGFIEKARSNLEKGIHCGWITTRDIEDPDYYRVLGTIEKYACNFNLALEFFNHALKHYKNSKDITNVLECLAESLVLRLEIYFWRKQQIVLDEAIIIADEFRSLVEGQELTGWSYVSKVIQAIVRAFNNQVDQAKTLLKDAQESKDINFFVLEHKKLLNINIDMLPSSRIDAINAIEFLTSLQNRAHRDSWTIEEKESKLSFLVVLDSESSLPVFTYYFDPDLDLDQLMISGLISAINTMSRSLSLGKELNEIHYQDSLVLVGHREPLLFALVCEEQAPIGIRLKFLQFRDSFPALTTGKDNFQVDLSDSKDLQN
ncbi:MAG: tetratricopeptide repeat protein, partial [Candidatus Hodarchaeales archaeon]